MNDRLKILERESYGVGAYIFKEGQQGRRAYIVQEGEVEILREKGATPQRLAVVGKGSIFGEMALIDDAPRMASAKALSAPTVLIAISRDMLAEKMKKSDPLIVSLLRIFAQNIRSLSERIDQQSVAEAARQYVKQDAAADETVKPEGAPAPG